MLKPILLTAAALVALLVAVLGAAELLHWRYRRLRRARRDDTANGLAAHFRGDAAVDAEVIEAVRSYFVHVTGLAGFPVRASDDLLTVYNLSAEDVQDAVAVALGRLDCSAPARLRDDQWAAVRTVDDLVRTVQRCRDAAPGAAAVGGAARWVSGGQRAG